MWRRPRSVAVAGDAGRVLPVVADLSQAEGVKTVIDRTVAAFGGLDILVNNVGLAGGGTLLETSDEQWREAIDQTLFPAVWASKHAVPHMQRRGSGAIVIIASIFGREAGGRMAYNAVKAAEISLAKSLAQQLASSNIRVNSVSPGSILFEGGSWWRRQQADPAGIAEFVKRELPFGRFGRPEEVGDVVAFLCSDQGELDQRHFDRRRRVPEPGVLNPRRPQRRISHKGTRHSLHKGTKAEAVVRREAECLSGHNHALHVAAFVQVRLRSVS